MSSTQARPLLVSTDDYSSAVSIIAWMFLVTAFFGVAARLLKSFLESLESDITNKDKFRREGLTELYAYSGSRATVPREAKEACQRDTRAKLEEYLELDSAVNANDRGVVVYSGHGGPSRSTDAGPASHDPVMEPTCGWESESQTSETKIMGKMTTLSLTTAPRAPNGSPFKIEWRAVRGRSSVESVTSRRFGAFGKCTVSWWSIQSTFLDGNGEVKDT